MLQDFLKNSIDASTELYLQNIAISCVLMLAQIKDSMEKLEVKHNDVYEELLKIDQNHFQYILKTQAAMNDNFSERFKAIEDKIGYLISGNSGNDKIINLLEYLVKNAQELKEQQETETLPGDVNLNASFNNSHNAGGFLEPSKSKCRLCDKKILYNAYYYKTVKGEPVCYKCGQMAQNQK